MSSGPFSLAVGDRLLDRFRIGAIFQGGLGVVWAVTDAQTGRRYAIKAVKPEHQEDAAVRERFLEEASTWIALDQHENLVQALWLMDEAGGPFLVLEYVEGEDLAAILARGPLPLARAIDLAMQCAAGMDYAHRKRVADGVGVVHRDLKPSNLLVTPDDRLKVTDFGLARVFRGPDAPVEPTAVGTPEYVAPEQLRGEQGADGRADIYSFGLVLYEMISGRNPLRAADLQEQVRRVLEETPPPLEEVPAQLSALVARCVAKETGERPHDFAEVLGHLAQVARTIEHAWHVDPATVEPPRTPTGLVLMEPVLRPRRPRAGEPFAAELALRGDVGPGPVELSWEFPACRGLELLTPAKLRVAAGGSVDLSLRASFIAPSAGEFDSGPTSLRVSGPAAGGERELPAFPVVVADTFLLPLAGRDGDLRRLRAAAEAAARGRPGALLWRGDTGLGKTRLLHEAARCAADAGLRAVLSRAHPAGLRPVRILHDAARQLFGLPDGQKSGIRAAINDVVGHDIAAARYFAEILLGGTALEDETPPLRHWFSLLAASAARSPVALLLDDLQFTDESTLRLVLELAAWAREAELAVLFVAAGASESSDPAMNVRVEMMATAPAPWEVRPLEPLDRSGVEALLEGAFPGHGFAEEAPWLAQTITSVTQGNPSHVTEILRTLRDGTDAAIRRRDDEWRVSPRLSPGRLRELVPGVLEDAVLARVATVSEASRPVLETAALVGDEFDVPVLQQVIGDPAVVDAALDELENRELVRPVDAELDRYRFYTPNVATLVRREIGAERTMSLHRAVAAGMLAVYTGERRRRRALSLARHLRRGGDPVGALPYTLAGCERLLTLQLPDRARRLLLNAKPAAASEAVPPELRARFDYVYGLACEASGDYDDGLEALTRYVESGTTLPDEPRSLPRAYSRLGRIHRARGEYERASYCYGVGRELLETLGDLRALAFSEVALGDLAFEQGHLLDAERHLERGTQLAAEGGNEGAAVQALLLRGRLELFQDRLGAARTAFREAEERARGMQNYGPWAGALLGLARGALRAGYLAPARERVEQAIDSLARMGDRAGVAAALIDLGDVNQATGRVDRALRHFRRAQRVFSELGHPEGEATARHRAGVVLRGWGRTTLAVRELVRAAEQFGKIGSPLRFDALRDLGRALAHAGATRAARLALARADRGAAPTSQRRALRVLSTAVRSGLARAAGDLDRAAALARSAARRAIRTTGHVARIAASLAVGEVALLRNELHEARRAADTALAFAREQGDLVGAAAAERILLELAARAGRRKEVRERAHRVARAYTGRADVEDGPPRLLTALGRSGSGRSERFAARARHCYARLEEDGFRAPA